MSELSTVHNLPEFSLVVAVDADHGIGRNGELPWRLSADLKYFKQLTTATQDSTKRNLVIMGRKTWAALPERFRPLPDRCNLILTRRPDFAGPADVLTAHSIDEALAAAADPQIRIEQVFVIGGGDVYQQAVKHPRCTMIYLTRIDQRFDCDTFFPAIPTDFTLATESTPATENALSYRFFTYRRLSASA